MKTAAQLLMIALLTGIYLVAFGAMLHPRVSAAYKSYYIDHTSSDWNPVHYYRPPEQGMDFGKQGLPEWVGSTSGLSFRDSMGRWTDTNIAKIPSVSFTRRFSGPTCVEITFAPAPALTGKSIAVRMGSETQPLPAIEAGFVEYRLPFVLQRGADRLELLLPEKLPRESEVDRSSGDTRRLGLALNGLRILPGSCNRENVKVAN